METVDENKAVDMTKKVIAGKGESTLLEKEVREEAKKEAKVAPKGKYFVAVANMKCDGKSYTMGDLFEGKMYDSIVEDKAVMTKEQAKELRPDVFAKIK